MRPAAIQSVVSRMQAIDARFGLHTQAASALGTDTTATSPSFSSVYRDTTAGSIASDLLVQSGSVVNDASAIISDAAYTASNPLITADPAMQGAIGDDIPFAREFEAAGAKHGVPPRLLASLAWVESRFQVDAVSPDGALGVMQIMPMTAQELGVDPTDPVQAIDGAARLLAAHHDRFGSWDLAMAAYHSGGGAVARAGNQAPPRAAEYVRRVHDRLESA